MTDIQKLGTVMIIDDDQIDQMMYERVLKRSGLVEQTMYFSYAEKALEYLKTPDREQIDIIFLDINMPRMNGFEFLDRATAELGPHFAALVVVMLTTSLNPEDEERAHSYDIVKDYISKPLTGDNLGRIVDLLKRKEK